MADFLVAKVNPKYLLSNSTSHTWPFSAIAELIDNAYDPDVSASQLWIDKEVINGKTCLTFVDNGKGMDLDHLLKMLSLGYCEKDKYETGSASHRPIGQYGNGFKSGSMRLAKDALVLTVQKEAATACVGLLSQTLCAQHNLDTVILPVMEFTLPNLERSSNADMNVDLALDAILAVGPYCEEKDLKAELWKINRQKPGSGTKIVLFNLRRNKNEMLELDFESDPNDIRNPETLDDDPESSRQQTKVFEYRQSLRRYCSILFLTPKMKIFIRNNQVKNFFIKEALSRRQTMKYRPKGKNKTEITFGYTSRRTTGFLEDYGMMFYHRNRLIKPYVKLGPQTKTDDSCGEEVVGVVDFCDILQPTHNKQEFLVNTIEYRSAMTALGAKLNQYCSRTDHHGDTEDEDRNIRWTWVQCGRCRKWRRLPAFTNSEPVPNKWYCRMNPDLTKNRCDFPQELTDKEIDTPSITRRSRGIKSSAISSFDNSDCSNDASEQEPDCVLVTAAPPTPATTSKGPEVVSHRKRKQPAPQRTVGGKRARSIRDVMGQEHRVGVSDVPTAQQDRLLARHVTQALFTSSNDQGCNGEGSSDQGSNGQASISHHAPSVVTDDDPGVSGHDEDDDPGVIGHDEDDDPGVSGHDEDDDTGVSGHDEDDESGVTGHDEDDDTGVTGHDEDDDTGVNGHDEDDGTGVTEHDEDDDTWDDTWVTGHDQDDESGVTGHDEDDDTGVTGHDEDDDTGVNGHDEDDGTGVTEHDEDDDTGVTREQAAESNEQLRRFRGNVHTLLSFLVDLQLLDLPDVGPLEEIEDYVQRLLSSLNLPLE